MQIHRVLGDDLTEALKRARASHGEAALVLGHEALPDGSVAVSVTSAEARESETTVRPQAVRGAHQPGQATLAPEQAASGSSAPATDPGLRDLERRLMRHGASARWAAEIARAAGRKGARGTLAIDVACDVIGARIKIAPSPKAGKQALVLAFVGATGVGKTTTLAKLAVRLTQGRRRVSLLTLDRERVGARAQLEGYAELLGCSVDSAGSLQELSAAIVRRSRSHVILLDTPAVNPRQPESLRDLALLLAQLARDVDLRTYAVLAATTQRSDLRETAGVLRQLRPTACVITKLDETRRPGGVLECAARADLPLAFTTTGRDAAAGLARPTPDGCADLLLRGRLA